VSGAIDEDTARAISSGRQTVGELLRAAQKNLQKVFIVFVVGFLGSFYALRLFVWDILRRDLVGETGANIYAITPFDVILLQAKIGLAVGILVAIPPTVYYGRDSLRARGWWPADYVPRWKLVALGSMVLVLFSAGVVYGYTLFFPIMFDFLAANALQANFQPDWSIVKWAEFVFLLTLSFGIAAQLPLAMTGLAYLRIVEYETFRDKWRYAVVGIVTFGALFSPPDPFTQIMWAAPLLVLYVLSLGLTKFVVTVQRSGEAVGLRRVARRRWNLLLGGGFLAGAAAYLLLTGGAGAALDSLIGRLPPAYRFRLPRPGAGLGVDRATGVLVWSAGAALVGLVAAFVYSLQQAVNEIAAQQAASAGAPGDIDLSRLDAAGVRAAPPEAFEEMTEDEAVSLAQDAIDEDDRERARAILDRYDEASGTDPGSAAGDADTGATPADPEPVPEGTWTADTGSLLGAVSAGRDRIDWGARLRAVWNVPLALVLLTAGLGYWVGVAGRLSEAVGQVAALTGLAVPVAGLVAGVAVGAGLAALFLAVYGLYTAYQAGVDPSTADLWALSGPELRTAPLRAYAGISEDEATALAERAVASGDRDTARAVFDRFDQVQEARDRAANRGGDGQEEGDVFNRTAAGMAGAFTEEETTEDDIGGYLYDIQFILGSLTSKAFRLIALFMLVMASVFGFLYTGGIGTLRAIFLRQLPSQVTPEEVQIVALHPVEVLVFEVKISVILGAAATLPLFLYYAWPAMKERGFVRGNRDLLFGWAGALALTIVAGSVFGFLVVAPNVISWLAFDVIQANMEIKYQINAFGWLVFFTTVGVGLLAAVPVTMVMFHRAGLVPYSAMRRRWRVFVIGSLVAAALLSSRGLFTMFVFALPAILAYGSGLAVLWVYTLGGRREAPQRRGQGAD
jgi:sec-independent protein translocase protein TatC